VFGGVVNGGTGNDALELASAAAGGTISGFGSQCTGFSAIAFDSGARWRVNGAGTAIEAATITGFAAGDTLDLGGIVANGDTYAGGVLTLTNSGTVEAQLTIATPLAAPVFVIGSDGAGGTTVALESVFGDLDGDGTSDLVFQNGTTGNLWLWDMNGNQVIGSGPLPAPSSGWNVTGTGDFFGNGRADLLFQNQTSNALWVWQMSGSAIVGSSGIATTPSPGWEAVAVADLNGDGRSDIVFQNGTTGQLWLWEMNGTSIVASTGLPAPSPGWTVVGAGDLYADGHSDILFQNQSRGALWVWEMNGTQIARSAGAPTPSPGWKAVGVGELAGGATADIVFQNQTSNALWEWGMSGTTIVSSSAISVNPNPGWHVRAV
jgi:hypothetical protein